jgi:putative ABC transport system ATP-binding protein
MWFRSGRASLGLSPALIRDERAPAAFAVNVLELERVAKEYTDAGEVVRAVDGLTLAIDPGKVLAIYGPSGSGKTTLLLLAAALLRPDRGAVRFAGRDLATLPPSELSTYQRREIGFIYQSAHLMTGVPAVENAAVKLLADGASLRHARAVASEWLERVGLSHRLDYTPEQLSGGERQRVAIARALVNQPRLILADEPTGNLDTRRGSQILRLLADIAREQKAAVLIATHDPQAGAVADRVCGLRDGKLVAADAVPALPMSPLFSAELAPGLG